jgi:uncharacterized membrane protein YeaQ/YmgE (transglycosylase-associated protein family)
LLSTGCIEVCRGVPLQGRHAPERALYARWDDCIEGYTSSSLSPEEVKMHIIVWIIFGLIVGAIAKLLMPGRDPGGWIVTILLGIAGALVGGFLGRAVGWYGPNDTAGFVMSLIGALVLLGLYRLVRGRTA